MSRSLDDLNARERAHIRLCQDDRCTRWDRVTGDPGDRCNALNTLLDQVEQEALQRAYQKLLGLHLDALLQHGGDVAAGVALGVKAIYEMLPDQAVQAAIEEWAESTPGDRPHEECLSGGAAGECPHTPVDG